MVKSLRSGRDLAAAISLTLAETTEWTGLSRSTIYRLFDQDALTRLKCGRRVLLNRAEVEGYIGRLASE